MAVWVRSFLLLLVLGLTLVPCSDAAPDHPPKSAFASNDAPEQDHCAPFCICACCASHVNLPASGLRLPSMPLGVRPQLTLPVPLHALPQEAVWQPPRA